LCMRARKELLRHENDADGIPEWLLLDSRVVDVPRVYNRTFVILSSLKPLFFNSLKNALRFSDNAGA
jgi:hypothetical protein